MRAHRTPGVGATDAAAEDAALAAPAASPALANRDIVPGNVGFAETVESFRAAAMHQPTFKRNTDARWPMNARRSSSRQENEDGADFFIYPDKAPKDVILVLCQHRPHGRSPLPEGRD
jgi:hypothetical protein